MWQHGLQKLLRLRGQTVSLNGQGFLPAEIKTSMLVIGVDIVAIQLAAETPIVRRTLCCDGYSATDQIVTAVDIITAVVIPTDIIAKFTCVQSCCRNIPEIFTAIDTVGLPL